MSDSKSKKHSEPHSSSQEEDELIHVPRGQSRVRFFLMVIVILAILVAFSITPAMMSTFSRAPTAETYVSWQLEGGDPVVMDERSFFSEKRALSALESALGQPLPLAFGRFDAKQDDLVAKFLVLEQEAHRSGMRVSESEIADAIIASFGSGDAYRDRFRNNRRVREEDFEDALGRWMLVNRYLTWHAEGASVADPDQLEEEWLAQNQEYAFDYVVVPVENYRASAEEQLPSNEDLRAWFDGKPENEKRRYYRGPYFAAEAAWLDLPLEEAPQALLDAYPPTEEQDEEANARSYYDLYYTTRFEKPEEERDGEEDLYYSFEEVKDRCMAEVAAFNSLNLWMRETAQRREAGEEIDLAAEAERLGLEYSAQEEPLTREQWLESDLPWAGSSVVNDIARGQVGALNRRITVGEDAFVMTRVTQRQDPRLPAFDQIQTDVAEAWLAEKMATVARLRLEQVRDALGNRPTDGSEWVLTVDGEKFGKAAVDRGFSPRYRDFLGRDEARSEAIPEDADDPEAERAVREFLARRNDLYQLEVGQVAEASTDPRNQYAFLVRLAGVRDADITEKLSPADAQQISQRLRSQNRMDFLDATYRNDEWYRERFQLFVLDRTAE